MRKVLIHAFLWSAVAWVAQGCESKESTVEKGRAAVKEVVTQPFSTLDNAKDSLRQSEDKQKAAVEAADKENQ
jgi:ABC-type transporter MlaC component